MRRFGLAAVTCLQGVVACGTVFGFEDPQFDNTVNNDAGPDAGPVVETPVAPGDPTRTCVPKPPADWQGPLIIFEGSGSPPPEPPSCPTGYRTDAVYDGFANLVAPDAACTCECGPETGAGCEGTLSFFAEKTCMQGACSGAPDQKIGATCTAIPAACGGAKLKTKYVPGTCAAKTLSKNTAPPAWQTKGRVCAPSAPTAAGCAADRIATPTTGLPFTTNTYCIAKSGEDECPDIYPRKRVYYAAINDSRDCDCTCAAPTGGTCSGTVTGADNLGDCTGGIKSVADDGDCHETKKAAAKLASDVKLGSCVPAPHPKGNATPTTPTTICCTR